MQSMYQSCCSCSFLYGIASSFRYFKCFGSSSSFSSSLLTFLICLFFFLAVFCCLFLCLSCLPFTLELFSFHFPKILLHFSAKILLFLAYFFVTLLRSYK